MEKFLLIIAPTVWQKLPLLGIGSILENLKKHSIAGRLLDINIDIYNKIKNKTIKKRWTMDYENFTDQFYKSIIKDHKEYFLSILDHIKKDKIKYIGFSVYKANLIFSLNFARLIKKRFPHIKIIFGGPHIAYLNFYNPEYLNKSYIDHFIIGEGEEALLDILNNKVQDKIITAGQIRKLNLLDFPKYKEFDLPLYERKKSLPVLLSRGCINQCNFCFERVIFKNFALRNAEDVIEEIKYHIDNNHIHWFTFYDSIFNGHLPYLEKFLKLIIKHKLKFIWDAQIGIRDDMDEGLLELMKKTGCINLFIGLESGSEYILKQMNKNFNILGAERFFKKLKKNSLNFEISLITNYPMESRKNFTETKQFLLKNKKQINKVAQVNPYIYYPGTKTDITKGYNFLKGTQKVDELVKILDKENIKYTNAYINNLIV